MCTGTLTECGGCAQGPAGPAIEGPGAASSLARSRCTVTAQRSTVPVTVTPAVASHGHRLADHDVPVTVDLHCQWTTLPGSCTPLSTATFPARRLSLD